MNYNSGNNSGFFQQGDNYNYCTFLGSDSRPPVDTKDLYKKTPALGIISRVLLAVVTLAAEVFTAFTEVNPYFQENPLFTIGNMFMISINGTTSEKMHLYFLFVLFVLSMCITLNLFFSAYGLLVQSRYGNLRRFGIKVVRIKPGKCPYCGDNMKLQYQKGNYLVCNDCQEEHRFHISLRQNRKE